MTNLSRMCSTGKHTRCLGTVLVHPPENGERIVPCQCSAPDCPHAARGAAAPDQT